MPDSLNQLTEGMPSLGSYAGVMAEIGRVLEDPDSTIGNLGEVIEKDPDLASRLLRLGNSAFYGFSRRLETVAEAVSLIGIQQIQDLILASSVIEVFAGVSPDHLDMESFWKHSLACGVGARCLAVARQMPAPEKFFVAGLLHDLGRLVLLSRAADLAAKVFALHTAKRMLLRQAEHQVLGFDHARIGEEVLRGWQFPPNLINAVAHHHQPLGAGIFQLEASIVHLADYLAHAMQVGSSGERFIPPLNMKAWERVGLPLDIIDSIVKSIDIQIDAVKDTFLRKQAIRDDAKR